MNNFTFFLFLSLMFLSGCTPKVQVKAPKQPIEIQLNVNISHEVHVKLDKEINNLIEKRPDLF